jgi:hypothetical protein
VGLCVCAARPARAPPIRARDANIPAMNRARPETPLYLTAALGAAATSQFHGGLRHVPHAHRWSLRACLGWWLWGSAVPARAQIRVMCYFCLHRPGSTATPKSGVANGPGRVERVWAFMGRCGRWAHLPSRPLSPTPTPSSSSCNGGAAPPRIRTGARRLRAEEVGAAPSLTSHAGVDGRLVLVESTMGSAARGSWWRRRWGGSPPADRPWSTPPPFLLWISSGGHDWGDPATTVVAARALWPATATGGRPRARQGEGRPLVARA